MKKAKKRNIDMEKFVQTANSMLEVYVLILLSDMEESLKLYIHDIILRCYQEPCASITEELYYSIPSQEYKDIAHGAPSKLLDLDEDQLRKDYVDYFYDVYDPLYRDVTSYKEFLSALRNFKAESEGFKNSSIIVDLATVMARHAEFDKKYDPMLREAKLDGSGFAMDFIDYVEEIPERIRDKMIRKFIEDHHDDIECTGTVTRCSEHYVTDTYEEEVSLLIKKEKKKLRK